MQNINNLGIESQYYYIIFEILSHDFSYFIQSSCPEHYSNKLTDKKCIWMGAIESATF